ncbi:tRNA lysidine(34) synthetase TilS [Sphingomicrobium astaxanthinifaciens]|uniref:tRNA lysidine(34) synthetase TilS n=1 Tax=Sphingomicrobium astaxanthinifaciens TaxID=1227949 RepID=UPI001FCBF2E1|nr:tRNA lysidine(34) synthetase TilS [Sphingomicrobium astaxanthinifaciens]MCJ7421532.1 tRNA lysidine(34) synthetase TilS [Sphingomicrobium astaxanthinifaciens]
MRPPPLPADRVDRLRRALARLVPADAPLGIAVSGGADSLALLLLAQAARPERLAAVTVDHRLHPDSAHHAEAVAAACRARGIAHDTLAVDWPDGPPARNVEAAARAARYALIEEWARRRGIGHVATAHHARDQAETMLMRLARGAGLPGLSAIREQRALGEAVRLVRPVLAWPRAELREVVGTAGLAVVEDPMNDEARFDRVRLRRALDAAGFADEAQYAASARHLAEAEEALDHVARELFEARARAQQGGWLIERPAALPRELRRRLLLLGMAALGQPAPRGPDLARAMERLAAGEPASLGKLLLRPRGAHWHLAPAPPRRAGEGG